MTAVLALFLLGPVAMQGDVPMRASKPLPIPGVRSGKAALIQQGRVTLLQFTAEGQAAVTTPLLHKEHRPQGYNPAEEAHLLGELSGHYLVFTDTFASNPGNIQGECGASLTGERFVHVVSLLPTIHETLSVPVDSCLMDIQAHKGSPTFSANQRTLELRLLNRDAETHIFYQIDPDGSVKALP